MDFKKREQRGRLVTYVFSYDPSQLLPLEHIIKTMA